MSNTPDVESGPPAPIAYVGLPDQKCSPYKPRHIANYHPGKHGIKLRHNATLDRRLEGDSSMGTTVLVELMEFMKSDVLPAIPDTQSRATLSDQAVSDARDTLSALFYDNSDPNRPKKLLNVKEDAIAVTVVNVINTALSTLKLHQDCSRYKATLSRYKANPSDDTRSKVDAALYEKDDAPSDDNQCPDWTNCRFYIEFKMGDTGNDPWDDRTSKAAENEAKTRASVRAQLIAYAKNVFLYQHRTALFSFLIIGNSFRAARWDRSGVIVSKKVDYADDPRSLLDLICHLVQLDPTLQGLDPTADLIKPRTKAFRIMNELAEPNSAQDMEYMEAGTENYIPPPAHPPPVKPPSEASATPSGSATVDTSQEGITHSARAPKQSTRGKQPASATPQAAQDLPTGISDAKEAPDADLPEIEVVPGEDLRVFRYVREKFRESLVPGWPRYKLRIKVRVGDKDEVRVFLVAKPLFEASSMFGRATRGYVAIDARTRRFVFLKDSWRPFYKDVLQEGTYLERFAGDDQIIVPAIVCHGDVANQCTYTAQYQELSKMKAREAARLRILKEREEAASSTAAVEKKVTKKKRGRPVEVAGGDVFSDPSSLRDAKVTLRHHIHYRMVVKDVCLPFEMFRSTEQLIRLMSNCVATHHYVYEKHQLLHRDISAGNVLILPRLVKDHQGKETVQWRGLLTDWELAKTYLKNRSDEKARQPERTGTWQFMSVAYVDSQWTRPISVADALESFFHVILFFAIRFLPHTFSNPTDFVVQYFDTFGALSNDVRECSTRKAMVMHTGKFTSGTDNLQFLKTDRRRGNPLNTFIREILQPFKARYEILNYEAQLAEELLLNTMNPPDSAADIPADDFAHPRFLSESDEDWESGSPSDPAGPLCKAATLTPPTQETRDLAALLDTHNWVLRLFKNVRRTPMTPPSEWVGTLVVQDQLVNYEPRIMLMRRVTTTQQTGTFGSRIETDDGANKRPRNAGSNFASSSNQLPETDSSLSVLSNAGTA